MIVHQGYKTTKNHDPVIPSYLQDIHFPLGEEAIYQYYNLNVHKDSAFMAIIDTSGNKNVYKFKTLTSKPEETNY